MRSENAALRILGIVIRIALVFIAALFIWRVAHTAYGYGYELFAQTPVSAGEGYLITVTVTESDSVKDVAKMLEDKGLIRDDLLFRLQERFSDYHGKIAPGTYDLSTAMRPEEMLAIMSAETVAQEQTPDREEGNSEVGTSDEDVIPPSEDFLEEGNSEPENGAEGGE